MEKGTIVLTPFPYTDLSTIKRRPAVIISSSKKQGNDVVLAFISSKIDTCLQETDLLLDQTQPDFKKTGLKKTSVIKLDKIVTVEKAF